MRIQLSDHFDTKRLLRFTLPSMVMMIFTSIYGVVDGLFVSNFAGKEAFTAVNFIMPFLMIMGTPGFMFGTGGSALVGMLLGQKNREEANRAFSLLVYLAVAVGLVLGIAAWVLMPVVASALGASGTLLDNCVIYGRIIMLSLPMFMTQMMFQSFFVTAERPNLGLAVTVISGVANMVLDAVLVGWLKQGLVGAAWATTVSQILGGGIPLLYFFPPNTSLLRLGKTAWRSRTVVRACTNGCSELMSNLSMSLVSMLYNAQLIRYAGEDGVAAYGVLMYVNMIFLAVFIGYSVGSAPVVSYHFGAKNQQELKNLLKRSAGIILTGAVLMFAAAELLGRPLSQIYVGYDAGLLAMTVRGFFIYSFSFLFCGVAIYGSSFFTALNDGVTSALISFLRTVVFQVAAVLLLPLLLGVDGIWLSMVVAELMAMATTVFFLIRKRSKYHYL